VDDIITRYFKHLDDQASLLPPGVCIFVYAVVPPVRQLDVCSTVYYPSLGDVHNSKDVPSFPLCGSDDARKAYVLYFNTRLRETCAKHGYRLFDVFHQYADEQGFLRRDLADATVHIHQGSFISARLEDEGWGS